MKLFEPIKIGEMWVKNRIVMPPMGTRLASEYGAVTPATIEYYRERAKGGTGLIITETCWVSYPAGKYGMTNLRADEDRFIAGLNDLTEAVHVEGAKIAPQLYHEGQIGTEPAFVSSASVEEIKAMIEAFGESAARAQQAGFDAIEVHGAHGFLINQFLSPHTNNRTDEYGGNTEGRARFALETIHAIRRIAGPEFPIIFRISADEFVDGGLTLDETKLMAQMLEKAGIDALHVSGGIGESISWMMQPAARPRGCLVHLAQAMKAEIYIPVITVGSIVEPKLAEQILQEGKADLIALGRPLIADPELPKKASQGKFDAIRPCIRCNRCVDRIATNVRIRCAVNAFSGREVESKLSPSPKPKRVMVVGGGPAGMEAARILALRGHQVSLWEKNPRLGGQLLIAAQPPHKDELPGFTGWLERQMTELGVNIELNKEVTPEIVAKLKPDTVILATGSLPLTPQFPISSKANVVKAQDILERKVKSTDTVIIVGGGIVGCETAEFLAEEGKNVTIVEMMEEIATDMQFIDRMLLIPRLDEKSVKVLTNSIVQEVIPKGIIIMDKDGNNEELIADTVVMAIGNQPNRELLETLSTKVPEVYSIGDCVMPRKIMDAIFEAAHIALRI